MEESGAAIVLESRAFGENDALITLLSEGSGLVRGLAHGGQSRAQRALWQAGNQVVARRVARLEEQLGSVTAEPVRASAALVMDDPLALAILAAACGTAAGAMPEGEPHPRVHAGLVDLLDSLGEGRAALAVLVEWELLLLAELGYGLDLTRCAVTGEVSGLAFVSPRTGRAVARDAAGEWADRLLPLPGFLVGGNMAALEDLEAGLRLTGHFLTRDAFGSHHRPLPPARVRLADRVTRMRDAP